MASIEDVRREIARRELARREKDRARISESQAKQDEARASVEPDAADNVKAFAANAANALSSDSTPALIAQGIASPATLPVQGAIRLAREAFDVDERIDDLGNKAPAAALAGTAAGALVGARGGKAPAASALRGAGGAAGSGASKGASALRGLADTKAGKVADVVTDQLPLVSNLKGMAKLPRKIADIFAREPARDAPTPAATESPVPALTDADLATMLERLTGPKTKPAPKPAQAADDIDYAKEADGFDPGGEGFMAWLKQQTPASAAKAVEKGKAQVAGTKVDRTPARGGDLRAEAVERITAEDVGSAVPKGAGVPGRPTPAPVKPIDGNAFLEQEAAKAGEAAGRAWKSLPLSPVGQVAKPLGDAQLKALVVQAAKQGKPNKQIQAELSELLGRPVSLYEFSAWADGARLGF